MIQNAQAIKIEEWDEVFSRLRNLGNSLKPIDDENFFFFEIVRELLDSTLTNYGQLRFGYIENSVSLISWSCRNLLELAVFTRYVLISGSNARRFGEDRLIDGYDIVKSLRDLELHYDRLSDTAPLDQLLVAMQAQQKAENVTATKFLSTSSLSETVGMKEEFLAVNKVCSKLVHPTAWSVLAVNKGTNSFPLGRELLTLYGVGYMTQIYLEVRSHNDLYRMKPNP